MPQYRYTAYDAKGRKCRGKKEFSNEKEYYEKFKKILSPEKLYKYRRAEYKFARSFMKGPDDKKDENKKK